MGKFVEILREIHEKKNIKIKINDNLEKLIAEATLAAE